jgi:hypothetical protein
MDRVRDLARDEVLPTTALETPLVLGLLMTVLPPIAVMMVWSTTRLPRAAQIALTLYGALTTIAIAAVAIAALL